MHQPQGNRKQNPGRCLPGTVRTLKRCHRRVEAQACGTRCARRGVGEKCIIRSYPLVPTIKPTKSTAAALRVSLQQAITPRHSETTSLSLGTPPFTEFPPRAVANQKLQANTSNYKRRSRATINELPTFILSTTDGST
jgi:hypothetical protein